MPKKVIHTDDAPKALGPYSQAVRAGNLLFLAGQIPLDPASGQIVGTTIAEQTDRVLKNIAAVLAAEKLTFANVVKSTCFLKDMNEFATFNEVYGKYVVAPFPSRTTVEVARLPKDVRVEIEMIAMVD